MKKTKVLTRLGVATLSLAAAGVQAQPAAVQQQERTRQLQQQQQDQILNLKENQLAPELFEGEMEDTGPQKVLRVNKRRDLFEALVDTQYFNSSNAFLTDEPTIDASILVNTAQFALAPTPYPVFGRDFSPRLGARAQWFNYAIESDDTFLPLFDFHVQTIFVDNNLALTDTLVANFGVEVNRFLDQGRYEEFYKEFLPNWGITKFFPIGDDKAFSIAYRGAYHITEVDAAPTTSINDRWDSSAIVSYTQELVQNFIAQPFYRFQHTRYTAEAPRNDYQHTFGMTLAYFFNKNVSIRAFGSYEQKQTDKEFLTPNYEKFDIGVGASLAFRF